MRYRVPACFLTVAGLLAAAAAWAEDDPTVEARISFASKSIREWRVESRDAIWVKGPDRWFRATLAGPCIGLVQAEAIAFDLDARDVLDKTGGVIVEGHTCKFRTFMAQTGEPPSKKELREGRRAEREARKQAEPATPAGEDAGE
jgi:hypothetical protein